MAFSTHPEMLLTPHSAALGPEPGEPVSPGAGEDEVVGAVVVVAGGVTHLVGGVVVGAGVLGVGVTGTVGVVGCAAVPPVPVRVISTATSTAAAAAAVVRRVRDGPGCAAGAQRVRGGALILRPRRWI
ncbi:hypothetical protein NN4_86940 [Nocardia ninae NBRC 108245]|uniref:Uncharacterized protein n=1 Tax=Nocardia ninae NBRC 108245 TaxID=1210091 RepID=A0A511MU98_9NOCA|nr:hypothetical protein NN4_86940 [Nocardia ninae NBRC 108245]